MTDQEKREISEQLNVSPHGEAFDLSELLASIPDAPSETKTETEQEKGSTEPVQVSAGMYVHFLDFIVSRGCSMYAKETPERFKMQPDEKAELEKAAAAYFETAPVFVSAGGWFALATLLAVSVPAYLAYSIRAEKDEAEKKIQAAKRKSAEKDNVPRGTIDEKKGRIVDFSERNSASRKRFEVDENGLFTHSLTGQYLKVENRNEKASQLVLSLKKEGKTNKEVLAALSEI